MGKPHLEKDDGMLACVLHEDGLEIHGAGSQDHLVALEGRTLHCQGHITERLHLRDREGYT
jgi:hypothetical protein